MQLPYPQANVVSAGACDTAVSPFPKRHHVRILMNYVDTPGSGRLLSSFKVMADCMPERHVYGRNRHAGLLKSCYVSPSCHAETPNCGMEAVEGSSHREIAIDFGLEDRVGPARFASRSVLMPAVSGPVAKTGRD